MTKLPLSRRGETAEQRPVERLSVLITGDAGLIGRDVAGVLREHGAAVIGFDRSRGEDVLDFDGALRAATGCNAIVHCAAIKNDSRGTPSEIFSTNVTGTWNMLRAAEDAGVTRFVYLSSAQVFGVFDREARPAYLPVDDNHPRHASRPYGLSKRFGEDLCAAFSRRTGMTTVALRPVAVYDSPTYQWAWHERAVLVSRPWPERSFVDLRDVTRAVLLALTCQTRSHTQLTLCASSPIPGVGREDSSATFATSGAERVLGWRPRYEWADFTKSLSSSNPGTTS